MKHGNLSPTVRFALPVMAENILTMVTTQIAAMMIGQISGASLAASGTGNAMINVTTAVFTMINTGSAVLISRLVGAGSAREAADTLEQAVSLLVMTSVAAAVLFLAAAWPLMRLLMPTAEAALMDEAVVYFRISAASFPFLMLQTLLCGALRAAGNSRAPMFLVVGMNALMALMAWLFIIVCRLGMFGAGMAYAAARVVGAAAAAVIVIRYHGRFSIRLSNLLRPRPAAYRRIFRIGVPMAVESVSVQVGYLIGNSLTVGLGTLSATVYQVCSSINNFTWMPNGACAATAQAMVGLRLGEGRIDEAKKVTRHVWLAGAAGVLAIGVVMALSGQFMAGLYSSDEAVISMSRPILWLMLLLSVPGMSVNTTDSTLRAGGDAKFVMMASVIGVWLIRLPFTWLLAYRLEMGVVGVFLANGLSLGFRTVMGLARFASGKWIHQTM